MKHLFAFSLVLVFLNFEAFAKSSAVVLFVKGKVESSSPTKQWQRLKAKATIEPGARIRTGVKGLVLLELPDKTRVKLRNKSEIHLESIASKKQGTRIRLNRGGIFNRVTAQGSRRFSVASPTHVAGVRGTEFFMAYGESIKTRHEKETLMCVREGTVEFASPSQKKSVLVHEGEGVVAAPNERLPSPKKLPWIKAFNWNMDPKKGEIEDKTSLKKAYKGEYDILDEDYD